MATATPANRLAQSELEAVAAAVLGRSSTVFANARVDSRALAMPIEWYLEPHGHRDRAQAYAEAGLPLAQQAAQAALDAAGLEPGMVDGIVFVSTTGIATPSLDARLATALGLRPDVMRLPVWGLGCAGGVAGLNRAAELAAARQGPQLLVCLELCSLLFDLEATRTGGGQVQGKKAAVAAAIFGDGCAAMVVDDASSGAGRAAGIVAGGAPQGLRHVAGASHLWPGTGRVMGWDVEDHNLDVVLDPGIPDLVRQDAGPVVERFLARHGPADRLVLHPGGARVLDAFADALGVPEAALEDAAAVLRAHGNMSSPTVLFALHESLRRRPLAPGERVLLGALGPGFACELALLEAGP